MNGDRSPRDEFLELGLGSAHVRASKPDYVAVERLRSAAAAWRERSAHFYAGYALTQAVHFAWGDGDLVRSCMSNAFEDFDACLATVPARSLEAIAAFHVWGTQLGMNLLDLDRSEVRQAARALQEELAERLRQLGFGEENFAPRAGFLVRGFTLATDFDGTWRPEFPEREVEGSTIQHGGGWSTFEIPSAFRTFVRVGDYRAAAEIADSIPDVFATPGLKGWRAAVQGLLRPEEAVERFAEAGAHFEEDVYKPETLHRTGPWDSINIDLWAKFFRARTAVAEIVRAPDHAADLLEQASNALAGTESGWVSPQVSCLRILVRALGILLRGDAASSISDVKAELVREERWSGFDQSERLAIEFMNGIEDAFVQLAAEPEHAIVSGLLPDALRTLGRIPLVGEDVATAIRPAVGKSALSHLLGQQRTWIYRTLESITDEGVLRSVILRMLQAQLPLYAQIRHGPIEYGKDIVVLTRRDGRYVLEMYQAKTGDITKGKWPATREELEEMFQVDMNAAQLKAAPDRREGILVFNGHLNPYVEPVVEGWLEEQQRAHGRSFRIMHIDNLVSWIVNDRLVNELRATLGELGIPIAHSE